jgi:CRP-like cAMP-binding protein
MQRYHALNQPPLQFQGRILDLLRNAVRQKKRLLVSGLLEMIEHLHDESSAETEPPALYIARALEQRSPGVLQDLLAESAQNPEDSASWHRRLRPETINLLTQPAETSASCSLVLPIGAIATHLESLLFEQNPLIQAASLFILSQIDPQRGEERARTILAPPQKNTPLVQDIARTIVNEKHSDTSLAAFPTLEKLVCLSQSDFFSGIRSETLIDVADRAIVKVYATHELITEQGDTCRELLLLMEGSAQVQHSENAFMTQDLLPGRVLDELEVLSHTQQTSTIVATAPSTRILAIPVDAFDDLLERDRDFARRVLAMESNRLRHLTQAINAK